ncbi:MAG TPA: saccharopine dehydrogenase NADP-binding domain-containing protein [Fimbriiglobus sp.]|jgi:short subunit dehydrogenase-like uncharacterized protein
MPDFLIYGAAGYTGALIAREAARRSLRPVLAGRTAEPVQRLASDLGLEHRVFSLETGEAVAQGIRDAKVVLNCAGPFSQTAQPVASACLQTGSYYLDITGEAAVFESLAALSTDARAAVITLLPGVGFDVVPSDCLAVHLKRRLPTANRLTLAFQSAGKLSQGTVLTALERMADGGLVRENGKLKQVPAAWKTRTIDFGDGPVRAMTIPWGDVATAFHSTGIPNIEVYLAAPFGIRMGAKISRGFGWLLRTKWMQARLRRRIRAGRPGPTEDERRRNRCTFWGEVADDAGRTAAARMQTPDGYDLTVQSSLAAVARVLAGSVPTGFQTPAMAFGPDFALEIPGVSRSDETP